MERFELPKLEFDYNALEPYISEQQLRIHHEKHHQGYVNNTNSILEKLDHARKGDADVDMKAMLKALSFNAAGHLLHSLFWKNLAPAKECKGKPEGELAKMIEGNFGSFERFKKEFSQAAVSVEGSGWAALAVFKGTNEPVIMQIEKHNANIVPSLKILMVIDVWEHSYYLDYKNQRAKFVEAFWNIVNWDEVNRRLGAK